MSAGLFGYASPAVRQTMPPMGRLAGRVRWRRGRAVFFPWAYGSGRLLFSDGSRYIRGLDGAIRRVSPKPLDKRQRRKNRRAALHQVGLTRSTP